MCKGQRTVSFVWSGPRGLSQPLPSPRRYTCTAQPWTRHTQDAIQISRHYHRAPHNPSPTHRLPHSFTHPHIHPHLSHCCYTTHTTTKTTIKTKPITNKRIWPHTHTHTFIPQMRDSYTVGTTHTQHHFNTQQTHLNTYYYSLPMVITHNRIPAVNFPSSLLIISRTRTQT